MRLSLYEETINGKRRQQYGQLREQSRLTRVFVLWQTTFDAAVKDETVELRRL